VAVAEYRAQLADKFTPELKKGANEQFFNNVEPFYKAMILFLCGFLFVLRPTGLNPVNGLDATDGGGMVLLALAVTLSGLVAANGT